jgi:ABC-type lipoprotein export system ATPase subunit
MTALLEMRGLHRTYKRGPETVEALRDVDLTVSLGQVIAIVGASGSGKTTLLNIAGGVDRPTSGCVLFQGHRMETMSESELTNLRRRHVGMIFQDFCIVEGLTALENVKLPLMFSGAVAGDRALEMLEKVGISNRRSFYPHQLSGGEQQRVGIARALINEPELLLADEPTGNLDSKQASRIFDLFRTLAEDGKAVLIATHNEELARRADRVLHLKDGALVDSRSTP